MSLYFGQFTIISTTSSLERCHHRHLKYLQHNADQQKPASLNSTFESGRPIYPLETQSVQYCSTKYHINNTYQRYPNNINGHTAPMHFIRWNQSNYSNIATLNLSAQSNVSDKTFCASKNSMTSNSTSKQHCEHSHDSALKNTVKLQNDPATDLVMNSPKYVFRTGVNVQHTGTVVITSFADVNVGLITKGPFKKCALMNQDCCAIKTSVSSCSYPLINTVAFNGSSPNQVRLFGQHLYEYL